MAEQSMFVPTASIPNIALSLVDDSANETSGQNYVFWPFKPILLFAVEGNESNIIVFRA